MTPGSTIDWSIILNSCAALRRRARVFGLAVVSDSTICRLDARRMADRLTVRTPTMDIAYEASGPADGLRIILLHGFPDDAHAFDEVAPPLAAAGYRVLAPYLRGYGATRFLDAATPRMAQQAAIGQDLIEFMDALEIRSAALGGYDWGGRAACITALLVPQRVRALVTIGGYNVQNTIAPSRPAS